MKDEFNELVAKLPAFNYQQKRRHKLQPVEKKTRRLSKSKVVDHKYILTLNLATSVARKKVLINKRFVLNLVKHV